MKTISKRSFLRLTGLAGMSLASPYISTTSALAKETKLVLQGGSPTPDISFIPIYVAEKAGFLKEEGISIEMRYTAGAPLAAQIVATGGADIGAFTLEPAILGYDKGLRGKYFHKTYTRLAFFIAVPENSPIKSLSDLQGKKIGVSNMGSASLVVARSMLKGAGVSETSGTFLPVGAGDTANIALQSGQVDALSLWDAAYAGLERAGVKLRYFYHPEIGESGNGGIFTTAAVIASKKEALSGFSKAIGKGLIFLLENPEAAVKMYWETNPAAKQGSSEADALAKGVTELKSAARSWDPSKEPSGRPGRFDPAQVETYIKLLNREGVIPKAFDASEIVTTEIFDLPSSSFDPEDVRKLARNWK
ncbi:ABC transporter substrate-binding protein [Bradyrhizobium sp.]|uniref:ABC transporter substrate-binding protein n=1 Tax=Bradyrhizobium sp. TaxID=376 RepID=UPI0039E4705F